MHVGGSVGSSEVGPITQRSDLVGRDDAVERVREVVASAERGQRGRLVVVSGPAGIGKSALCDVAVDLAAERGFLVGRSSTWTGSGAPPLWSWIEVLRSIGGELDGHSPVDQFVRFDQLRRRFEHTVDTRGSALVVVDDFHLADDETGRFVRALTPSLGRVPLIVVIAFRETEATASTGVADGPHPVQASSLADVVHHADTAVRLAELEPNEADLLLDAYPAMSDRDRERCRRLGAGNPLLLHEAARMVSSGSSTPSLTTETMIIDRIASWSPLQRGVVRAAAVMGRVAQIGEIAAIAEVSPVDVVDAAERTDGLVRTTSGSVEFRHDLIRQFVLDSMPTDERVDLHRRSVAMLASAVELSDILRRAEHAILAAPASMADAASAVQCCRVAARRLQSDRTLDRAAEFMVHADQMQRLHPEALPDARLAVDVADAVLAAGDLTRARERFARAVDLAASTDDLVSLSRAALGLGGVWVEEERNPVDRDRHLALLRRCARELPAGEDLLHARIAVRLAAERVYEGSGSHDAVAAAVRSVRSIGDDRALAEALSLQHHVMLAPWFATQRRAVAAELLDAADRAGDSLYGLLGRCWRTVDLFLLGDPAAEREFRRFQADADAMGCLSMRFIAAAMDAMRSMRDGELDVAESKANDAYALGVAAGDADSMAYLGGQIVAISWARGEVGALRPMLDDLADSPTLKAGDVTFAAVCAAAAAFDDDHMTARAFLQRVGPGRLVDNLLPSNWLTTVAVLAEAARELGDLALAGELLPLIEPYRDLPVRASLAVACLGPAARVIGVLHGVLGQLDDAIAATRAALDDGVRIGNRPVAAITAAELAELLDRRGRLGDHEEARQLLQHAIDEGERLGLTSRVVVWRSGLERVEAGMPNAGAATSAGELRHGSEATVRVGALVRHPTRWSITVDGRTVEVVDSVGMRHLAELVSRPDQPIDAVELAAIGVERPESGWSVGPMSDEEARRAYGERIAQLDDEIETARRDHDAERLALHERELEQLVEHLRTVTGRRGRARFGTGSSERARMRVSKAIRRAIDRLGEVDELLGRELARCITTGRSCSYVPDPVAPRTWTVERSVNGTD